MAQCHQLEQDQLREVGVAGVIYEKSLLLINVIFMPL